MQKTDETRTKRQKKKNIQTRSGNKYPTKLAHESILDTTEFKEVEQWKE